MFNNEFKKEIDKFLSEIETRRQEVLNDKLETTTQVGKSLLDFARKNFTDEFPIVYCVGGIRLDSIFHLGSKQQLHNGSDFEDVTHLFWAVVYEILANKNLYTNISLDDFYFVYWGYLARLMKNFNWSMTNNFTIVNQFGYQTGEKREYLEWMHTKNIFSDEQIESLYKYIFVQNKNRVKDINGDDKQINTKKEDYNIMKRISKEELINIINTFNEQPTVPLITTVYNKSYTPEEKISKYVSVQLMRSYIKSYGLEDMIKSATYKHSENFLKNHR